MQQLTNSIGWFSCGFLVNAIMWRLQAGKLDDIHFPIIILTLTLALQFIRHLRGKDEIGC